MGRFKSCEKSTLFMQSIEPRTTFQYLRVLITPLVTFPVRIKRIEKYIRHYQEESLIDFSYKEDIC